MSMVKFGANKIFRTNDATVSDADIDKILEEVRATLLALWVPCSEVHSRAYSMCYRANARPMPPLKK